MPNGTIDALRSAFHCALAALLSCSSREPQARRDIGGPLAAAPRRGAAAARAPRPRRASRNTRALRPSPNLRVRPRAPCPPPPPPATPEPQCATPTLSPRSRCGWSSSSSVTSSAPRSCGAIHELGAGQRAAPATPTAAAGAARAARPHAAARRRRDVPRRLGGALDTSDEVSDDSGARRVRSSRAENSAAGGRGRAQSAPPQPQRARSVLDAARVEREQRAHLPRELRAPVSARSMCTCVSGMV